MEKFLSTVIVVIITVYLLKYIFRLLFPWLLKLFIKKAAKKGGWTMGGTSFGGSFNFNDFTNAQESQATQDDAEDDNIAHKTQDGIILKPRKKNGRTTSDLLGGEYVDYTEK